MNLTTSRPASAAPLAVLVGSVTAVVVVAAIDPEEPGHYPTCPFLSMTGWWCPGCGSLRAVHALAHGDLGTAIERNVLTVLAVPALVLAWVAWLRRTVTGRSRSRWAAPPAALWALLATILGFWVLRNVPFGSWLAP